MGATMGATMGGGTMTARATVRGEVSMFSLKLFLDISLLLLLLTDTLLSVIEPPRGKTNNVVSEKV